MTTSTNLPSADQAESRYATIRDALQDLVRNVEIGDLINRIRKFRELDFKRLSRDEIAAELRTLLLFGSPDDKSRPMSFCMSRVIDAGTCFYRIRTIDQKRTTIPLPDMKAECDAWEPPADWVKAQRLNQVGEPVLYTSDNPSVALEETKVSEEQIVPVIVYESVAPLHVTAIGMPPGYHGLDANEQNKLELMTNFLRDEFKRHVGIGTEYLYKISDILAKEYFSIPEDLQDGWQYPSIARNGGVNFCFKPQRAKSKLALQGFIVGKVVVFNDQFTIAPLFVAQGFDQNGKFCYHPLGSAAFKILTRGARTI